MPWNWVNIGLSNVLPDSTWTNDDLMFIRPKTYFYEASSQLKIFLSKKIHLKMLFVKCQPYFSDSNMLIAWN